jgi:Flp pilus assembly protein TadG
MRAPWITGRRSPVSRAGDAGAAAVEFALVAPLLVLLICGIVDLGRAYATLNQLTASAREGARVAAVMPNPTSSTAKEEIRKAVQAYSKGLGGPEIPANSIVVRFEAGTVTVTVQDYPFTLITPLARLVPLQSVKSDGTIAMTRRATFRWERAALPAAE